MFPDYSKLEGTGLDLGGFSRTKDVCIEVTNSSRKVTHPVDKPAIAKQIVGDAQWERLTYRTWVDYFISKAKEHGIRYIRGDARIEASIIKSLMKNFNPKEIKDMMDFVWDVWEYPKAVRRSTLSISIFSKGWLNTIAQSTIEWKKGTYGKETSTTLREWREPEKEDVPVKKKKSRVFI